MPETIPEDVLIAGEKLRSFSAATGVDQREPVKITGNHEVDSAGAGESIVGVAAYDRAGGQEVTVIMDDCEVKVEAGDAVTAGDGLEVDADGNFVPVDTGEEVALALESAGANDVFQAYLTNAGGN